MKLLYGLTEKQMWEVAKECEFENWKSEVETAIGNNFDYEIEDEEKIITATKYAIDMWEKADCHNDYIRADIIENAILNVLEETE